jgi:nucleotide-binding universal stress UspA family protein
MLLLPLQTILWPTDFSECSYASLRNAVELAAKFDSELWAVHIVPAVPRPVSAPLPEGKKEGYEAELAQYEDALHTAAQQKLHQVLESRVPRGVKTRMIVGHGEAASEIARIAEDERVGLIVIATHGMTGWSSVAFGSVAERVVRLATRPVLSLRVPCGPA